MADDGMLVNFDIPADAIFGRQLPSFQGGRWKDRLRAKRIQRHRTKKDANSGETKDGSRGPKSAGGNEGSGGLQNSVGEKEGKQSDSASRSHNLVLKRKRGDAGGDNTGQKSGSVQAPPPGKDGQFVSSLWTFNPTSTTAPVDKTPAAEQKTQAPSNAPLSDGSATFITLGIFPILANHLTTKLALKAPTAIQRSAIPELISSDSDAFIQAETGSGKTLTYLLPMVNRIMSLSTPSASTEPEGGKAKTYKRHSGLYAVILAPTRELSRQISTVLSTLIHAKNGPHWIVPGCVIGGEKKKSEKARLRKGVNILVATPGRLLDHLQNTESLDVSRVRWVVMDEGDRLMELGFEETIGSILEILEKKSLLPKDGSGGIGEGSLPKRRVTMLCSATMKTNVQRLGEISLKDALYIKAEKGSEDDEEETGVDGKDGGFMAPAQLRQNYVVVPAKLRLVGLNAVLKRAFLRKTANPKVIVFFSCSDSVDFHFEVFSRSDGDEPGNADSAAEDFKASQVSSKRKAKKDETKDENDTKEGKPEKDSKPKKPLPPNPAITKAPLLHPSLLLHKLHGSLPQTLRTATLASFTNSKQPSILFCTDVAARGLDLPNLDLVVQCDPPFSKDDHLHRIGRTARAGKPGKAIMFLLPGAEEGYVTAVLEKGVREGQLIRTDIDEIIKKGFADTNNNNNEKIKRQKQRDCEDKATEWHLGIERWVLENPRIHELAARAWGSHIRAYTTHSAAEKVFFNHRTLHYGHLAKAFGLRDKPGNIKVPSTGTNPKSGSSGSKRTLDVDADGTADYMNNGAKKKMRSVARAMERKGGLSSEFNLG